VTGTDQDQTAAACWDQAVRRHGPRRFMDVAGHECSYAEFDRWARAVAAGLSRLGAVAVPLDPWIPAAARQELIQRSGAAFVIAEAERTISGALDAAALAAPLVADGPEPEPPRMEPNDPWAILFTSGSTRPYPPSARVRLVDADGRDVDRGETGELLFAHPAVMTGYLGEPPPPFGWISSGDLMRQRPDGGFAYAGRAKAVIKRGGENISAHEVERVLAGGPAEAKQPQDRPPGCARGPRPVRGRRPRAAVAKEDDRV
jgi:acyl-CoA synthetase (AMP-forming)/AMP-acid ligase II